MEPITAPVEITLTHEETYGDYFNFTIGIHNNGLSNYIEANIYS
jgi:hypothetical protein